MTQRDSFDDMLDAAIEALRSGASREQAIAVAGGSAATMGGLLDTAQALSSPPHIPAPVRLVDHYDIVRAAVERSQIARSQMIPSDHVAKTPWWSRRFHVASLAVPAGLVAALALFGFAAAAGGIATTSVGHDIAGSVRPGWVEDLVETGSNGNNEGRPGEPGNPAGQDGNASGGQGNGGAPIAPGSDNGPQVVVLNGTVAEIVGGNFTLTTGEGEFHIQIDVNTIINGEVLEGATATVEGELTAEKNLHATSLTASGGSLPEDPARPDNTEKPDDAGPPEPPANVPGNHDKTPPAGPPPLEDLPPGGGAPGAERTPPAQGNPAGGQSSGGNGADNSGGNASDQ